MDGERARGRGVVRLLVAGAVLFGLFLMHGAPPTGGGGCHGVMRAPVPVHEGHDAAAMASADVAPDATHPRAAHVADAWGTHGSLCVSTPARDRTPLPVAGLVAVTLAVLAARSLSGRPVSLGRTRLRGPPAGGRDLLLLVCVART